MFFYTLTLVCQISQFLSTIHVRSWQMDSVNPKGSKCSLGSLPTHRTSDHQWQGLGSNAAASKP